MNKIISNELKQICAPRFNLICEKAGLSDKQIKILNERCLKGNDITITSYNLGMCETSVKKYYALALKRIEDYKNYLQLSSIKDIKEREDV